MKERDSRDAIKRVLAIPQDQLPPGPAGNNIGLVRTHEEATAQRDMTAAERRRLETERLNQKFHNQEGSDMKSTPTPTKKNGNGTSDAAATKPEKAAPKKAAEKAAPKETLKSKDIELPNGEAELRKLLAKYETGNANYTADLKAGKPKDKRRNAFEHRTYWRIYRALLAKGKGLKGGAKREVSRNAAS
jgi:hypothetical protein